MIRSEKIEAWARLIRISQAVLAAVEADLKAAGYPPLAWYDALLELSRDGAPGLRPFELGERILLAQYNLSRLADRLEAAGHLRRAPCPDDARGQILRITDKGLALLDDMWPVYREAIGRRFAAKLSDEETASLTAILGKIRPADRTRLAPR
jgi:DNA-binding MarR family transcriptional regulator